MKLYSCLIGSLLSLQFVTGQPKASLTIGDTLPESMLRYIQNYPTLKTAVPNLSGKWMILDFMSPGCGSCIQIMPRLDSLQKKYAQQLQIFLVTKSPADVMSRFSQKIPIAKKSILPILAGDSALSALFPYLWISHEVWIDPNRIVRAITRGEYVNDRNIRSALFSKTFRLPLKTDVDWKDYDGQALIKFQPATDYYSSLLPYDGIMKRSRRLQLDSATGKMRLSMLNYPVLDMYRYCINALEHNPSQILLQVADTGALVCNRETDYWTEWEKKYSYGYEATFPQGTSPETIKRKLQADLDAWFNLKSSFEKRLVDCYVLKESAVPNLASVKTDSTAVPLRISAIRNILNRKYFGLPVVDERKNKIEMATTIPESALSDIEQLQLLLSSYGLDLTKEKRKLAILTILDNKRSAN